MKTKRPSALAAFAIALIAFVVLVATPRLTAAPADEVRELLTAQAAAWNRGDIEAFMQSYLQSDTLRFASGGTVTYGWKATLERYQKRYPDRATMGTLAFTDLAFTELAPDALLVFGRWKLTREKDMPNGLFTLTVKKTKDGWRIVQDHTSSAP